MHARLPSLALLLLLGACRQDDGPPASGSVTLPDGGRYQGALVEGRLQGEGRLEYPNGAWYQGHFANGQFDGQGEWHGADGNHYRGEFRAGLYEGEGRLERGDQQYQGQFRRGLLDGRGALEMADGSSHKGLFAKGRANGKGVFDDGQGNRYDGEFRDGQLQGPGTYRDGDGDRYDGGFRDTRFDGQGRYRNADGDLWSGHFSEGALNGEGEYQGSDGSHYKGGFLDWRFSGKGELQQSDGQRYRGEFANGKYAGLGTLRSSDGQQLAGTWSNGQRRRDEHGALLPNPLELGLLAQGHLLETALAALPPSTPRSELYALSVGGDGQQSVFLREADYVARLLGERFAARGVITLVNNRNHLADRPMATRESIARALRALAERSGPEDLIFIYLTSHGSHDHQFILDMPGLRLDNLPAAEMAELLAPLKQRDKILVVSACYSGGFIEPLKDDRTLIITAARSDRVSFGCSEEADFTYFGQALFADALHATDDLLQAFELASAAVARREKAEHFEASQPQIWAPPAVLAHWQALRATQGGQALSANLPQARVKPAPGN